MRYIRPLMQVGPARPDEAIVFGACWFTHVETLSRSEAASIVPVSELTEAEHAPFRNAVSAPQIMGILNTTPDSFSDGGKHNARQDAVAHGQELIDQGADILDIGGESTRPGAATVGIDEEIARTAPVISDLRTKGVTTPISIDTRKAAVAEAGVGSGRVHRQRCVRFHLRS